MTDPLDDSVGSIFPYFTQWILNGPTPWTWTTSPLYFDLSITYLGSLSTQVQLPRYAALCRLLLLLTGHFRETFCRALLPDRPSTGTEVRVPERHPDIPMSEELLDSGQIDPFHYEPARETVTEKYMECCFPFSLRRILVIKIVFGGGTEGAWEEARKLTAAKGEHEYANDRYAPDYRNLTHPRIPSFRLSPE
jgi:hypothetical protein